MIGHPLQNATVLPLREIFSSRLTVTLKKEEFDWRGGNTRVIQFTPGGGHTAGLRVSGKTLYVSICPGLPSSTSEDKKRLRNYI